MKNLIFLTIVLLAIGLKAQDSEINWLTFEEALSAQKQSPKKIMMDVYTNWCGPCKLLDKQTFHNKNLVNYVNEKFYAVKFNGESKSSITYNGQNFSNPKYDAV